MDHLVKNIKEGKEKQKPGAKKEEPKGKADTIYMIQSWEQKTRHKVVQEFSKRSEISFPILTADNALVEPLTTTITLGGHDIHHNLCRWRSVHRYTIQALLRKAVSLHSKIVKANHSVVDKFRGRKYITHGEVTTTSRYWKQGAFCHSLDKFHGDEIIFSTMAL